MSEMTEAQRKYHERQEAYKAAQDIAEQSSEEVMAKVRTKWEKAQKSLQWVLENKPNLIQSTLPFLFGASKDIADEALKFVGWCDPHESIAIYNHHNDVFHYEKVREKFAYHTNEDGSMATDPETGKWIIVGRRGGDKWITGKGERVGHPFPISLFEHVFGFGSIVVCEGEKDALNLNLYGIPALTMGAAGIGWFGESLELLRDQDVILWFDNDRAGREGTLGKDRGNGERSRGRYEEIKAVAKSITLVDWSLLDPEASNKADATDYLIKIGNIGPDALIQKLKYCAYRPKVSRTWNDVAMLMAQNVTPLRSERDNELAFMLGRFVDALKDNSESKEYPLLLERANDLIAKDEAKAETMRLSRLPSPAPEDAEDLKKWEIAQAKAEKVFHDAIEDTVLLKYFNRTILGDLRKHVTSDVVLHWEESFDAIGVRFGKLGNEYLYWCGTHYAKVEAYQFENTFNDFLKLSKVNIKQRYNETSFKAPARAGILSNAYHINDLRDRWKDFAVINHQNGMIVIDPNGNITHKNHDEGDGMMYVLPFAYDPDAKMPMFQKFLDAAIPDEAIQMIIAEYIGYIFLPKYVQKFLFLYGSGGNGKSTLIDIIKALLDPSSISNLEVLNMHGHELDALNGKILNLSTELESNVILNQGQISNIKKISVGEELQVNPKFDKSYVLKKPPKCIMAGNEKLKGGGMNDALTRRMILVPFEHSIPESAQDVNLVHKIVENELPGVLNWAIEGMLRFVKNNNKFTRSSIIDESMEEYRVETDQIYAYIKACFGVWEGGIPDRPDMVRHLHDIVLIYNPKHKIPTQFIYQHYCLWAANEGLKPIQQRTFSSKLAEKLKTKISTQRVHPVTVTKGYAAGDSLMASWKEDKTLKCLVGFSITSEIKININGLEMPVMETIKQGGE